jgi:hypothetical protein
MHTNLSPTSISGIMSQRHFTSEHKEKMVASVLKDSHLLGAELKSNLKQVF